MLQLAVAAHVEVANEVVLADRGLLHGLIRLRSVPASLERIGGYRFRGYRSAGMMAVVQLVAEGRCTREVRNGSKAAMTSDLHVNEAHRSLNAPPRPPMSFAIGGQEFESLRARH